MKINGIENFPFNIDTYSTVLHDKKYIYQFDNDDNFLMHRISSTNSMLYNPTTYNRTFNMNKVNGIITIYTQSQPMFIFNEYLKIDFNVVKGANTGDGRFAYIILYEPK